MGFRVTGNFFRAWVSDFGSRICVLGLKTSDL